MARIVRRYTGLVQNKHVIRSCFGGIDGNFVVSGSEGTLFFLDTQYPLFMLFTHQTPTCTSGIARPVPFSKYFQVTWKAVSTRLRGTLSTSECLHRVLTTTRFGFGNLYPQRCLLILQHHRIRRPAPLSRRKGRARRDNGQTETERLREPLMSTLCKGQLLLVCIPTAHCLFRTPRIRRLATIRYSGIGYQQSPFALRLSKAVVIQVFFALLLDVSSLGSVVYPSTSHTINHTPSSYLHSQ